MKRVFETTQARKDCLGDVNINELTAEIERHTVKMAHIVYKNSVDDKRPAAIGSFGFHKLEDNSVGKLHFYSFVGKNTYITFNQQYDELKKYNYDGDIVYLIRFGSMCIWIELD